MPFEDNDWLIGLRNGAYDLRSSSSEMRMEST